MKIIGIILIPVFSFIVSFSAIPNISMGTLAPPPSGCYTGIFPGWDVPDEHEDNVSSQELVDLEELTGKAIAFTPFSVFWGENKVSGEQLEAIARYGAVPMLRLMPWGEPYWVEGYQEAYSLQRIIDGDFDQYLTDWADRVKEFGRPVMVNFGVEMNGDWFPWSGTFQGGGTTTGYGDPTKADGPERFVDAFRHIIDLFRNRGAANATWYFHANHESFPEESWNTISAYYPGDDYIDWLGFSVYGVQYQNEDWHSFNTLMGPAYNAICALSAKKPVILAEWGVGEYPSKGDKAAWYAEALDSLPTDYPRVKIAVVYSERWQNNDESWSDLRIDSSPAALSAYQNGIASDYYLGTVPGSAIINGGDYNGDGTSDIALFRPSSGLWALREITRLYFGGSNDQPIPGDYDGDGTDEVGIFRPGSGLWSVRGITRVYFGSSADTPIPLDFNGDGRCNFGIFRPNSGLWAIRGITRIHFGSANDQPTPGDYDGDGTANIGIFRSSSGLWSIRGLTRTYFGGSSDLAVPGDYNGTGVWSPGILRATTGLWAIKGITRTYFGSSSDLPVPADYNGSGSDSIGIFRGSSGLWAVQGVTRVYFGSSSDIPVTR
ncbi:MAG TPA: hypothetical protein ENH12_05770 [Proteobacteria bacterium]|nr:hypothetical protein [Pseudomonadota bacterium]